jgi:multidrug efflux pump subunit AcrA (membrane-fusion protein)
MACADRSREDDGGAQESRPSPTLVAVGDQVGLALDSTVLRRMGIRLATLASTDVAPQLELPATVVPDPGATTMVRAGVGGRLTALEAREWPRVGERLEAGELIAQVGDARPIAVPRGGTVARLLSQPGELVQPGQVLLELVDFSAALIRVAWADAGTPPLRMQFGLTREGARFAAVYQGAAPEADPLTRGPALLYRAAAGENLRPGVALLGFRADPEAPRRGVVLPSEAVVQWDALAWAYVERGQGRFIRARVSTDHAVVGGWLVGEGFSPGDRVVIAGAGQLLSEEFRARITVGEEVGE